jgi:peptidoglycan/LPS O-acetylase OafA/YrhL
MDCGPSPWFRYSSSTPPGSPGSPSGIRWACTPAVWRSGTRSSSSFFLVSGFLLYRPFVLSYLSGERSPNTRRFWQRRLLRIMPAYWLALTLLAYVFHLVAMGPGLQGVVCQYLFLQIYFTTQIFFGISQAWSLCTEMSFYLVPPSTPGWSDGPAGSAGRHRPNWSGS